MNYGFHLSTAGVITGMRRLDVLANNLANASTVGFKADVLTLGARLPENLEAPGAYPDANAALDALGGGTLFRPNAIDATQGQLRKTEAPLDLAIEGDGYFVLERPTDTRGGAMRDALVTRAGALTRSPDGRLVLATTGAAVLSTDGLPIELDETDPDVRIDRDGRITQSGQEVARLALVVPEDPASLRKEGRDALRIAGGRVRTAPEATSIAQGWLEESTVDPIAALADLVRVSRGIEFSTRLMQQQDQMTGRLIDTFGRFA